MSVRAFRTRRWPAFLLSLVVLGSAGWTPTSVFSQGYPGGSGAQGAPSSGGASYPVSDETFKVADDGDSTKKAEFEVGGITTGTTRTFTLPDASSTICVAGVDCNFSVGQTFTSATSTIYSLAGSAGTSNAIRQSAEQTPDTGQLLTGSTGNSWLIHEWADFGTDFGHALTTNPTVFVQSADATQVTQFASLDFLGVQPSRMTVTVDGATTFALTGGYILLQCTGAETINTITGATRAGVVLYIENTDTDCTIADDDSATAANAIDLTGAAANDVGAVAKVITLIYNGSHWLQTAESDN